MIETSNEITPLVGKVINDGDLEILKRSLPLHIRREIGDEDIQDLLYEDDEDDEDEIDVGGKLSVDIPQWTTREIIVSVFSVVTGKVGIATKTLRESSWLSTKDLFIPSNY